MGGGWHLFETGYLLTFLPSGWAHNQGECLFEVGCIFKVACFLIFAKIQSVAKSDCNE